MRPGLTILAVTFLTATACSSSPPQMVVQPRTPGLDRVGQGDLEDLAGWEMDIPSLADGTDPMEGLQDSSLEGGTSEDGWQGPDAPAADELPEPDVQPDITPACPEHEPCDDGDPCTTGETCIASACQPEAVILTAACLYSTAPNISQCSAGTPSAAARTVALAKVNRFRALSGLPPVAYDAASDQGTQDAALIMTANNALNHEPPDSWHCWSEAGFLGAGASNLHRGWSTDLQLPDPAEAIAAFLVDLDVESLGHRRWLLDPFLQKVSYGASHGKAKVPSSYPYGRSMALKVIYPNPKPITLQSDFVAYPSGDYPSSLVDKDWYLSFSMVADKQSKWANEKVDLTAATVSVQGPGQNQLSVYGVATSNEYFGLPNHIKWKVAGLQEQVTYTVFVNGLKYSGKSHSFQYNFKLVP